jgi:hypothetical protein
VILCVEVNIPDWLYCDVPQLFSVHILCHGRDCRHILSSTGVVYSTDI